MTSPALPSEPTSEPSLTPPPIRGVPSAERRAIVVGASSGMGAALVRRLAAEGYRVAALARREAKLVELAEDCRADCAKTGGAVFVHVHDVARQADVSALFEEIVRELGGLDLIVYAAGIMPATGPAEYDTEKDLAQVTVNLGGCIAWCNEAAKLFRTQRSGTIIGISSIAGDRGRKGNPVYCATKAAMNTYLEALRNRLSEVGVHVLTVKPGFIDTPMTEGLDGLFWLISADDAARTILTAARHRFWNTRYVPLRWWAVGAIIRSIPSILFRRLNV
ncbi:MAG: SDR family NAD(P)-dependent oxidoreductase [Planctomycetota bacterium]|nr:MAG: SDR family NAD(P)-dependent oxidoreductase [Planctomycetota bacterium]